MKTLSAPFVPDVDRPHAKVSRSKAHRLLRQGGALVAAMALCLPLLRFLFDPGEHERAALRTHEARVVTDAASESRSVDSIRRVNPEWDLMRRMYLALALTDAAMAHPEDRDKYVGAVDKIARDLVAATASDDPYVFLLPYAKASPWQATGRSLFVDGEVAVVLEARLLLSPSRDLEAPLAKHISAIEHAMNESPTASGESYPGEAWTFCNTTALLALRMHDVRVHTDHEALARKWIAFARARLVDQKTGLLGSRYRYATGYVDEGPEGSSIFMSAHNLKVWDEAFARDQYERARALLTFDVLGFGLAREWPSGSRPDIDSGPIVPLLGASPASSGMALLGATTFGDADLAKRLRRSLNLAAIPRTPRDGELSFAAAGPMGNAVVLLALGDGALIRAIQSRSEVL
ncbi:MAG: hypothetical protein U0174_02805 [Polyangiaceae bacterium]